MVNIYYKNDQVKIEQTPLKDSFILTPTIFNDERGSFHETFNDILFKKVSGQKVNFVQDNQSTSSFGALRGMHYQVGKMAQAKLVRVIQGRILDIVVDMRKESETFGKHFSVILDDISKKQLFIPRGLAHGFITLSPTSKFAYKCDNFYDKNSERGIIYNDATLQLDWHLPNDKFIISEKDLKLPSFLEAIAK
jgi:dTDP-4-dehydrorhamnose 3,5-epimerase